MNLTNDWKTGRLLCKNYWVKLINGDIIVSFFNGLEFSCCKDFGIREVLAPCDYEELQRLEEENDKLRTRCANLQRQGAGTRIDLEGEKIVNERLRNLLRECLAHLSFGEIGTSVTPINELVSRINAALGESEG